MRKEIQRFELNDEDGAEVIGKQDDAAKTDPTQSGSVISWLKGILTRWAQVVDDSIDAIKTTSVSLGGGEDTVKKVLGVLMKPVASATYAPQTYKDYGTVTKANITSVAANVFAVYAINRNAAVRYFQIHNKSSAPAAGETPVISLPIPAGTTNNPGILQLDSSWFSSSERVETGLGWAISTTQSTFTDSATASDHSVHIRYVPKS